MLDFNNQFEVQSLNQLNINHGNKQKNKLHICTIQRENTYYLQFHIKYYQSYINTDQLLERKRIFNQYYTKYIP